MGLSLFVLLLPFFMMFPSSVEPEHNQTTNNSTLICGSTVCNTSDLLYYYYSYYCYHFSLQKIPRKIVLLVLHSNLLLSFVNLGHDDLCDSVWDSGSVRFCPSDILLLRQTSGRMYEHTTVITFSGILIYGDYIFFDRSRWCSLWRI